MTNKADPTKPRNGLTWSSSQVRRRNDCESAWGRHSLQIVAGRKSLHVHFPPKATQSQSLGICREGSRR
jgi:hypothetical protein